MTRLAQLARSRDTWSILFLASWHWIYFSPVALGQAVWYSFDIIRLYLPVGVELSRALASGRLPFWTPGMLAGFPLLAEGHAAAFYPLNLFLYKFLPPSSAISYTTLFHLSWMAVGMYACVRSMKFGIASALLAGLTFSFNGFTLERIYHTPIIVTSAWLPWLLFLQQRFERARGESEARAGIWFLLTTLTVGIQLVAGFPQVALLSVIVLGLFGIWRFFETGQGVVDLFRMRAATKSFTQTVLWTGLPLLLGVGIAAIQIFPTVELIGYSTRNAAQSDWFLTEYSLPPAFLAQFVMPYAAGEPIDQTNEYWAYFGFLPFILTVLAPFLRPNRRTFFLSLFALGALLLALGRFTPLYQFVYRLPIFSLFRTPARYVFPFLFAATLLSATAFEELTVRLRAGEDRKKHIGLGILFGTVVVTLLGWVREQPLDSLLRMWQVLPFGLAVAVLSLIGLVSTRKITRQVFSVAAIGLVAIDLSIYAPLFALTLNPTASPAYAESIPRSVSALEKAGRVYTDVSIVPSIQALRASLYPNVQMTYGKEGVQAYSPLAYSRHEKYLATISPTKLALLNVRYLTIPLEPRYTDRVAAPNGSLALDIINNETSIPPTTASTIEITSLTEQSADLPPGTPVAEIVVTREDGSIQTIPLRIGIETDDWDYDRANALGATQHDRARIARSFAGFVRAFSRPFEGHTYLAHYDLAEPGRRVVALNVRSLLPNGRLCIEGVSLIGERGQVSSLANLTGKANFALAFMSDTVAAWENLDVMPRAFIAHAAEVADDDAALVRLQDPAFRPDRIVLLNEGLPLQPTTSQARDAVEITNYQPERVELSVTTDQAGYLVLTDSWYPGWSASVDSQATPIYRADVIFRAVSLPPGRHSVVFEYQPFSVVAGAAASIASLIITAVIAYIIRKRATQQ